MTMNPKSIDIVRMISLRNLDLHMREKKQNLELFRSLSLKKSRKSSRKVHKRTDPTWT